MTALCFSGRHSRKCAYANRCTGESCERVFTLILEIARLSVGFLRDVAGVAYVDLGGLTPPTEELHSNGGNDDVADTATAIPNESTQGGFRPPTPLEKAARHQKVFLSHGRNLEIVSQVKTMLNIAEVDYEIAVEDKEADGNSGAGQRI